jgi:glycosyltransferase involved in cell wall biosynthesis
MTAEPAAADLAIAWQGLPPYAVACVREYARRAGRRVLLIGTAADVPFETLPAGPGVETAWVDPADGAAHWSRLTSRIPARMCVAGWAVPAFNALARQVREAGGKVALLMDNRWRGDLRQWIAPLAFRIRHRRHFAAAFVPGASARRYATWLGLPSERVFTGLYGADPEIFRPGAALSTRPRRFLFVGRLEERKGVRELFEAWRLVHTRLPDWELALIGAGPLRQAAPALPRLTIADFLQPAQLAPEYREARFLVLPSHEDHWGLVVHEAALAGCGLVLSRNVGARHDLATARNAIVVPPRDAAGLAAGLEAAAVLTAAQLDVAGAESRDLAARFGPPTFAAGLGRVVDALDRS